MRITSDQLVAGQPVLAIRKLLRLGRRLGVDDAQAVLGVELAAARRVLTALARLGYLEPEEPRSPRLARWRTTLKGNALALAKATPPLTRATADRLLRDVLARVQVVNASDHYLYRVERVVVFGSYLSRSPTLGDVDVAIRLQRRFPAAEQQVREQQRSHEASRGGRRFSTFLEQIFWPQREVQLFLKGRSRGLSLHSADDAILKQAKTRVIYRSRRG